jgi:hypothetical protein
MTRKLLAGFVPLLAVTALAATPIAAQAGPPELGRCVKVASGLGKYADAGCEKGEVKTKGTFEWFPGAIKNHFTSVEGKSVIETVGKIKIVCKADTDRGEYTGPKTDLETITFTGCKYAALGTTGTCQNGGAGEITTNLLTSVLGFIAKPTTVGVSLEGPGGIFAEFNCGPLHIVITGSVIAPIIPISKMTLKFKEIFKATVGLQNPEKFESEPKDTLLCEVFEGSSGTLILSEQCGFTSSDTVTNEELLEVNEVL